MNYWIWLCAWLPFAAWADGEPANWVQLLKQTGPGYYRYEETRELELASQPWHAQGFMLTDATGNLVKLQTVPQRVIMAIAGEQLYYWDPINKQRHSASIEAAGDAAQQIAAFRAILQGRIEQLQADYEIALHPLGNGWQLRFTPKAAAAETSLPSIEIAGNGDTRQRDISIRQADGEITRYRIDASAPEAGGGMTIDALLREAAGE
ncbi:outer membrane lipoprotein carrier protein LolA [Methylomonas sp. HYX-M1]|uniref:LolA family protein n=1 Tax=Methylomonas sp. HYX-M1 TaxID=3139307 RepID=UPI00345C47ED